MEAALPVALVITLAATLADGTRVAHRFPPDPTAPARLLEHLDKQPGLWAGFIDPTQPPYSAKGDGVSDDGPSLQSAVDDAYTARMSVVLPAGKTFLMAQQLGFLQRNRSRAFGFQIFGGDGPQRPVLKLKDGSTVANDIFLLFQLEPGGAVPGHEEGEHYNSRIRGINIDLGNNPTVSGLSMSGAQQCSIEDVLITGQSFYAGVNGLPGSGGFSANVAVIGGDYGIVESDYRPNPSVNGLRLTAQGKAGVLVNVARGPVVLSGFLIESSLSPLPGYRAVLLANLSASQDNAFNAEDGTILMHGGRASTNDVVAIESNGGDIVLKNVYVSGATVLLSCPEQQVSVASIGPPTAWVHVTTLVFTVSGGQILDHARHQNNTGDPSAADKDAQSAIVSLAKTVPRSAFSRSTSNATVYMTDPLKTVTSPPTGLLTMHSWNLADIPTWESSGILDVVEDYGATPQWVNATDDDGARIQRALADSCNPASSKFGSPVFIPHGEFGLAGPLDLLGCAQLFGSGTHSTALATLPHSGGGCWPDALHTARCSPASRHEDFTGNDLLGPDGRALPQPCETPALCCAMCTSHDPTSEPKGHCGAWSWNNHSRTCWMKTAKPNNPNTGSTDISGVVNPGAMLVSTTPASDSPLPRVSPRSSRNVRHAARGHGVLASDFSLYTAPECPFLDFAAGVDFLFRDVGISLAGANTPPPIRHLATQPSSPDTSSTEAGSVDNTGSDRTSKSVLSMDSPPPASSLPQAPYVALRGGVSGKFFGFPLDGVFGGSNAGLGGPLHVLILISASGDGGPIHLYQPSTEHLAHDPQVLVTSCRDVHFHSWKYESSLNEKTSVPPDGSGSLVRIENSQGVSSFGASGNYRLFNVTVPMIDVRGSVNVSLLGMVRKPAWNEPAATVWLRDDGTGGGGGVVTMPGDNALLLYRSPL